MKIKLGDFEVVMEPGANNAWLVWHFHRRTPSDTIVAVDLTGRHVTAGEARERVEEAKQWAARIESRPKAEVEEGFGLPPGALGE